MPKKQNGFGNPKSFAFKGVEAKLDKGKVKGAAGFYPSDRRFGSTVNRTIIEKYNLDSDWTRWRRGYEYYNQGAYLEFGNLQTLLYQGTDDETPVQFTGQRFATKNADSNTHYSVKREVLRSVPLGSVTEVLNNRDLYPENYASREIWARVEASVGIESTPQLLRRCIGERVTDGFSSANITNVMTTQLLPAVYRGKTASQAQAKIFLTFPLKDLGDIDPQSLINEVVIMEQLNVERTITSKDTFIDADYFFGVQVKDQVGTKIKIVDDDGTNLPPSLLEISSLPTIVQSSGTADIESTFVFNKDDYQRFYRNEYLTAERVEAEVDTISYSVLPFKILAIGISGKNVVIESVPFLSSAQLFARTPVGFLVFNDKSFTTIEEDSYKGVYYHKLGPPDEKRWERLNTDIDPWMDEVFTTFLPIKFANTYACSCPDYLHAILRMPETSSFGQKINRQRRAPAPSAQSNSSFEQIGFAQIAGKAASWETLDYKTSHRMCKHTIASHFADRIKVEEPKSYPTLEARESFEEKLAEDIKEVSDEFSQQLRRSEITAIEIIAVLATSLNLSEVEIANLLLNQYT